MSGIINALVAGLAGAGAGYGQGLAEVGTQEMRTQDAEQLIKARSAGDIVTDAGIQQGRADAARVALAEKQDAISKIEKQLEVGSAAENFNKKTGFGATDGDMNDEGVKEFADNSPKGLINRQVQARIQAGYPDEAYKIAQVQGIGDKNEIAAMHEQTRLQMAQDRLDTAMARNASADEIGKLKIALGEAQLEYKKSLPGMGENSAQIRSEKFYESQIHTANARIGEANALKKNPLTDPADIKEANAIISAEKAKIETYTKQWQESLKAKSEAKPAKADSPSAPTGLPAGTTRAGESNGVPVYRLPSGKLVIQKQG